MNKWTLGRYEYFLFVVDVGLIFYLVKIHEYHTMDHFSVVIHDAANALKWNSRQNAT